MGGAADIVGGAAELNTGALEIGTEYRSPFVGKAAAVSASGPLGDAGLPAFISATAIDATFDLLV